MVVLESGVLPSREKKYLVVRFDVEFDLFSGEGADSGLEGAVSWVGSFAMRRQTRTAAEMQGWRRGTHLINILGGARSWSKAR